jgi:hypothetical protein
MRPVAPIVAGGIRVALATGMCLAVHGCTGAAAGAVELSWRLRPEPGVGITTPFVSCGTDTGAVPVDQIRLEWTVTESDGSISKGSKSWPCLKTQGATGFDLAPGAAQLSIKPICRDGSEAALNTYIAPAPIDRDVTPGGTVSLGAVVLVLQTASCDQPGRCICQ